MMNSTHCRRAFFTVSLLLLAMSLGGCNVAALVARSLEPATTQVHVKAAYLALENKSVAVLVIPNAGTQLHFPNAQLDVCQQVTAHLAVNVPGIKPIEPNDIVAYQNKNPHWITLPYGELLAALKVDRIVHISLTQYRVHEPGNRHQWRGMIQGRISVAESDANNPDNFSYTTTVSTVYPSEGPIDLLNSDRETIELGTLKTFAKDVSGIFHDYEYERINP